MTTKDENTQRTPGRRQPCCTCMMNAVMCQYIKRGYVWFAGNKATWVPWTFNLAGDGWREVSPIHFCPFCGMPLDVPED